MLAAYLFALRHHVVLRQRLLVARDADELERCRHDLAAHSLACRLLMIGAVAHG